MYCEALRLCPVANITLEGIFDYEHNRKHFWSTDAGIGQALAYAQQAAFTLELSFKAYLEVLGKLTSSDGDANQRWKNHELAHLFKLLTEDEKKELAQWWDNSEARLNYFKGTIQDFLSSCNRLYTKWRYITDLTNANISIDIPMLLSASCFLLTASRQVFKERFPIKFDIAVTTLTGSVENYVEPMSRPVPTLVEGVVRDVRIPEGFDPSGLVELVIESEQYEHEIIVPFRRSDVKRYYGLEGKWVSICGEFRENEPHLLNCPFFPEEPERELEYTFETLTLQGSVYDMRIVHSAFSRAGKVNLVLLDDTFFSQVDCFFVADEERGQTRRSLVLGDKVQIGGYVTLQYGQPLVLVGPDHIEIVSPLLDNAEWHITENL